jgi:hypothetical protein
MLDILIIGGKLFHTKVWLAVLHCHWQKMIAGVKNAVKENLFMHTFKKGAPSLKSLSISLFSYYTWLLHKKKLKMARISIKHNHISMSIIIYCAINKGLIIFGNIL